MKSDLVDIAEWDVTDRIMAMPEWLAKDKELI